jgi:hypothetical protein
MNLAGKHRTAWIKIGVSVNVAQALHLMTEPPSTLPFSAQEERRRTLWSIYLLDKLATCGRHRPSLFLDRTLRLRLPCSEDSFETSTPEQMVTLEEFPNIIDTHVEHMETLAPTIAMTSLLSQIANYAFGENITSDRKEPWDHTSEYQTIRSRLARFETFFDCYGDVQEKILSRHLSPYEPNIKITESTIFTYTLYQLCYCLLQHPFLIRRRLEKSGFKPPANFLARTFSSCSHHARELTRTLENARHAQYKVSATFLSYSSLVAGSIHCLFQHSLDCLTRVQSVEALQSSIMHINEKGKYWKTSSRMVCKHAMRPVPKLNLVICRSKRSLSTLWSRFATVACLTLPFSACPSNLPILNSYTHFAITAQCPLSTMSTRHIHTKQTWDPALLLLGRTKVPKYVSKTIAVTLTALFLRSLDSQTLIL